MAAEYELLTLHGRPRVAAPTRKFAHAYRYHWQIDSESNSVQSESNTTGSKRFKLKKSYVPDVR